MRLALISLLAAAPLLAADLEFKEAFADPARRAAALDKLVPGSRDWFFYRALHQQLTGDNAAFQETIKAWKEASEDEKREVSRDGWQVLDNRRILLAYQKDPKGSVEELIRKFGLTFDDVQPESEAGASLADRLDPALISDAAFREQAEKDNPNNPWTLYQPAKLQQDLDQFDSFSEEKALWFYRNLSSAAHPRTIDLLKKVYTLPKNPPNFSANALEKSLTHAQLEALLKAVPRLRSSQLFSAAWMMTLPTREKAGELDPVTLTAHLALCRNFILQAPPSLNSLKANVLYHHLKIQREVDNYPLQDFLAYLRLPRLSHSILRTTKNSVTMVDATADVRDATGCDPIGDDTELVQALLEHFLAESETTEAFADLIEPTKLAELQARAHLLAGHDPARWSAGMKPAEVADLQKETRVGFAPRRPAILGSQGGAEVALELKNTPNLLVRAFEIDLPRLAAQRRLGELSVSMDIDGLVPHLEKRFTYSQTPLQVHQETIPLPELSGAGAWLVECVSGNATCRTLIRKGQLLPVIETTATGVEARIFDENGTLQPQAKLFLSGHSYAADADGVIRVTDTGTDETGYVVSGKQAAETEKCPLETNLQLRALGHLDREQMLPGISAKLLFRPRLTNHYLPLPLDRVRNAKIKLEASLANGAKVTILQMHDVKLEPVMEIPFRTPEGAEDIRLIFTGQASGGADQRAEDLEDYQTWLVEDKVIAENASPPVAAAFFSRDPEGYFLEIRGHNGEPYAAKPVGLQFTRAGYLAKITLNLKTGERGRIPLGQLDGIDAVQAEGPDFSPAGFDVKTTRGGLDIPSGVQATTDDDIRLPLPPGVQPGTPQVRLIRYGLRDSVIGDYTSSIHADGSRISIHGLAEGSYKLTMGETESDLSIIAAAERDGFMIQSGEAIRHYLPELPSIASAGIDSGSLVVRLQGVSPDTRVQLIARRFFHKWDTGDAFKPDRDQPMGWDSFHPEPCEYLTEKLLSDESRYILERRNALRFPGSMLPRPGLLVNRWTQEGSKSSDQKGGAGSGGRALPPPGSPERPSTSGSSTGTENSNADLPNAGDPDFLAGAASTIYQLQPGPDGTVRVPLQQFGNQQIVEVIATSPEGSVSAIVPLPASPPELRERRLMQPLEAGKHYIGRRTATVVAPGTEIVAQGAQAADWRAFSSLEDVYQFLSGRISGDKFTSFLPLLEWEKLPEESKLAFLADHPSHELHLFLARRDRPFFDRYVKPRLLEKREPEMMDDLLLGRDLSRFLQPVEWKRLNAVEKALLAQALPEARARISRELDLRWQLEAPGPEEMDDLFASTLGTGNEGSADPFAPSSSGGGAPQNVAAASYILQKLKTIIIPSIDFQNTTVEEAIDFLRLRTKELDVTELDPSRRGLNFVIRKPRVSVSEPDDGRSTLSSFNPGDLRIKELRLRNVPLSEALRYICEATRLRYKMDDYAITLVPATETSEDLVNRVFTVKSNFASVIGVKTHEGQTIQGHLREMGVSFPDGASVVLTGRSLVVRNTPTCMDLIETIVEQANQDDGNGIVLSGESPGDPFAPSADPFAPSGADPFAPAASRKKMYDVLPPAPSPAEEEDGLKLADGLAPWDAERDMTRVWKEQNYYRHRGDRGEAFIRLNSFWLDLAKWNGQGKFLSAHFNECANNVNEALLCLAVLDLPLTSASPEARTEGGALRIKSADPMLLFYRETKETSGPEADAPILVRQSFYRLNDRFRQENGSEVENAITGDFVAGVPYGMSVVVTNPTGGGRRVEMLAQIPSGAIPLQSSGPILSSARNLGPYAVLTEDLSFYFPVAGTFPVYPLHVADGDKLLATTPSRSLSVVAKAAPEKADSWPALARAGSPEAVLERVRTARLADIDLGAILWRLHDRSFYDSLAGILRERLTSDPRVLNYSFFHGDATGMRQSLESGSFDQVVTLPVGAWLDSPLLEIRPVRQLSYESTEFDTLVNPRSQRFAAFPRLSNPQALSAYETLLDQLDWKPAPDDDDRLSLCYFLFLQDRVEEALKCFDAIDPAKLHTHLQYDYLHTVTCFYRGEPEKARAIAVNHLEGPQEMWVKRFRSVIAQADEIAQAAHGVGKEASDEEQNAPSLQLTLGAGQKLEIESHQLASTEVKYYQVDLEMLFSKNPFLSSESKELPEILPNEVQTVKLDASGKTEVEIPARFRDGNVLVSATSGENRALRILDSPSLTVTRQPAQRTLQVLDTATRVPLPGTYVKVYAMGSGQEAVFHKDGYTDLRGKFDYLTLPGTDLSRISRLAILTVHPDKGARVEIIDL